jgi:release factor glutamine methyltransferase
VLAFPERILSTEAEKQYLAFLARRAAGEPVAYIIGHRGFHAIDLALTPDVLIPRPETELLVDLALQRIPQSGKVDIVDLGTGSGAIALSLADELLLRDVVIWATDASSDALDVARANLAGLGRAAANVRLAQGWWWEALPGELQGRLDLVVSNPPYVGDTEHIDASVADWEPAAALFGGTDGLDALQVVAGGAARWLRAGGALVCEIGEAQGDAARELAAASGLVDVEIRRDLAGRDRVLVAHRP